MPGLLTCGGYLTLLGLAKGHLHNLGLGQPRKISLVCGFFQLSWLAKLLFAVFKQLGQINLSESQTVVCLLQTKFSRCPLRVRYSKSV